VGEYEIGTVSDDLDGNDYEQYAKAEVTE